MTRSHGVCPLNRGVAEAVDVTGKLRSQHEVSFGHMMPRPPSGLDADTVWASTINRVSVVSEISY